MTDLYPKNPKIVKDLVIKSCKTCIHEEHCPGCCQLSQWEAKVSVTSPQNKQSGERNLSDMGCLSKKLTTTSIRGQFKDVGAGLTTGPLQCPKCGSDNVIEGSREIDGTPVFCNECEKVYEVEEV